MSEDLKCLICESYQINRDRCIKCRRFYEYLKDLWVERKNE